MSVALEVQSVVRARVAALAWLNVFTAAASGESNPALTQTLSLEWHDAGVHLIGCDGTALFRSWVPAIPDDGGDPAEWPQLSEVPNRSIVIMDPDGFGKSFMSALLRVTNDEDHQFEELTITTSATDDDATIALGAEFMTERVTLRECGQRIDLKLYQGPYPDWRGARFGIDQAERVEGLTIAPRLMALVGKLKGAHAVDMEFYGDKKHVAFTARGDVEVRGLLMPMRRQDVPRED